MSLIFVEKSRYEPSLVQMIGASSVFYVLSEIQYALHLIKPIIDHIVQSFEVLDAI